MSEEMWARIKECNRKELYEILTYVNRIRVAFGHEPSMYDAFLRILHEFKYKKGDVEKLVEAVNCLFDGYPKIIEGFCVFLPRGYSIISVPDRTAVLTIPSKIVRGVKEEPYRVTVYPLEEGLSSPYLKRDREVRYPTTTDVEVVTTESESPDGARTEPSGNDQQSDSTSNDESGSTDPSERSQATGSAQPEAGDSEDSELAPLSTFKLLKVEDAHWFLNRLKSICRHHPKVFNRFLDIMKLYLARRINTGQVIALVHDLFRGRYDIIAAFHMFLPPAYQLIIGKPRYTRPSSASPEPTSSTTQTNEPLTSAKTPDSTEPTNSLQHPVNSTPPPSPVQKPMDPTESSNTILNSKNANETSGPVQQPMDPTESSSTVQKSKKANEISGPVQQPRYANGTSSRVRRFTDPFGQSTPVQQQNGTTKPSIPAEQLKDQIVPSNSVQSLSDQNGTSSSVQLSDQTGISSLPQQLTVSTRTSIPEQLTDSTGTLNPEEQLTDSTGTLIPDEQLSDQTVPL